jgi:hypothetical protein
MLWSFALGYPFGFQLGLDFQGEAVDGLGAVDSRNMHTATTKKFDDQGREEAHEHIRRYGKPRIDPGIDLEV